MLATQPTGARALVTASPEQAKKDETPGLAGTGGFEGRESTDSPNCTGTSAECKAADELIARAALAGFELVPLAGGTWEARRWGLVKPLARIAEVEAWLERAAGGAR